MSEFEIGILGGGQLARMTVLAAHRAGVRCLSLDPDPGCPAAQVGPCEAGRIDDPGAIAAVLRRCGRVTLENEFVPAEAVIEALRMAGRRTDCLVPSLDALAKIQDKLAQRRMLEAAGVPQPDFVEVDGPGAVEGARNRLGGPIVLKRRFGGYDGKGTWFDGPSLEQAAGQGAFEGLGAMAEAHVPFRRELAVMVAVSAGVASAFPTVATLQTDGICDLVWTLDEEDGQAAAKAQEVALQAALAAGGDGLFGIELFQTQHGAVLVNEMAPRPHNSGHYTLDWGGPSQFEAHWRCVLGLPLPALEGREAAMANLLGPGRPGDWARARAAALREVPEAFVHGYGKAEARKGRKLGHINAAGPGALEAVQRARAAFFDAW